MEITQDWEKKFQIGTKQKRPPGHAGIGFLYKLIRFNRALLIKPIISHYGIYAMNQYIVLAGGKIKCRRCLATSTRTGQQCQRPALRLSKTQKCQFHGGRSTGSGALAGITLSLESTAEYKFLCFYFQKYQQKYQQFLKCLPMLGF